MNLKKLFGLSLIFSLLLPKLVLADLIMPLSAFTIPFIPILALIEALIFWYIINKLIKIEIKYSKLLLVTFIANIVTSALGTLVPIYRNFLERFMFTLIPSILIEWGLYIPFFRKIYITKWDLFKISSLANLTTYILLAIIITFT